MSCLSGVTSGFSGEFMPLSPLELFVLERFTILGAVKFDYFFSGALLTIEYPLFRVTAVFLVFRAWLPRRLFLLS